MRAIKLEEWVLIQDDGTSTPLDPDRAYKLCKGTENKRTVTQNAAMHKYFGLVSEALNDAGYSVAGVLNYRTLERVELAFEFLKKKLPAAKKLIEKLETRVQNDTEKAIPWSPIQVKELLWKPIMAALFGYTSTTRLKKNELTDVHRVLHRVLAERYGIDIPFPSIENMLFEQQLKEKK